jgi:hypothetical protein
MVQYRAIDRRLSEAKMMEIFLQNKERATKDTLLGIAERVAFATPVDTGTYASKHEVVGGGRDRGFASEPGYIGPRGQSLPAYQALAYSNMTSQIEALPPDVKDVIFRNSAAHATFVERRDSVYARARREFVSIATAVKQRLGLT